MRLLLPKTYVPDSALEDGPFFFLAGPIRGGGDWQMRAACLFRQRFGDSVIIANPSRYNYLHPQDQYRMQGDETVFKRQLPWERHYMEYAAKRAIKKKGVLVFHLARQVEPRAPEDGPYARDTLGELGEWRGRMIHEGDIRLLVSAEESFSGLDIIKRNFEFALKREFPLHAGLEALVEATAQMIA